MEINGHKIPPVLKRIKEYYEGNSKDLTVDSFLGKSKNFFSTECSRKICGWCPSACEKILGYDFLGKWCLLTIIEGHCEKSDIVIDALNTFLSKNVSIKKTTQKPDKMEVVKMETKSMVNVVKKTANVASIVSIFVVAFVLAIYKILKTDGLFEYDLRLRDWSKKLLKKMESLITLIK